METPDTISFEDFLKVDIRSGTVTKAERVSKSDKLLHLEVFFGPEIGQRTILAGIAKDYDPDFMVGTRVLAVVNLAPRKMMGFVSHGMLLAGADGPVLADDKSDLDRIVTLATCFNVPDGTRIG